MASNLNLEKDEIIGRAAALRGVSPEKFIEDVRRISSGRGMCAHSREYFFRPSNVRTLDTAARPEEGSRDRMDRRTEAEESLFDMRSVAVVAAKLTAYNDLELARIAKNFVDKTLKFRGECLGFIDHARALSFTISACVRFAAMKYAMITQCMLAEKIEAAIKEYFEALAKRVEAKSKKEGGEK